MAEWIYFLHPPRENVAATMTDEDPVARGGFARAELRPYQPGFLRGRDDPVRSAGRTRR